MSRPHVVIIGCGFAGLSAARALRTAPVDLTIIDRTNHHLFQPLLYQVAAGLLSPADIAAPTRFLLRRQQNARVILADVTHIDVAARRVTSADDGLDLSYDYLILATGTRHSYFGRPEWEPLAPGLKTLDDARELRSRFLLAFEEAERADSADSADVESLLTFVIVGGGPTGVELSGILPTLMKHGIRRDYRRVDPAKARVILLEAGSRILPTFPEDLADRARRDLERLGVQVRTGARVTAIAPDTVFLGDEAISARTVFWAAGNEASGLVRSIGVGTDRAGRALVNEDLSIPEHPEVFVAGDAAAVADRVPGATADANTPYVPGLAAAANQMGVHAARMIRRSLEGQPRRPFRYRHKGSLAIIGRNTAIADFGRLKLSGAVAFFFWLFVHLLYLAGFRNRVSVALEWGYAYFTYRPGARVISDAERSRSAALRRQYEKGGRISNSA